MSAFAKVTTQIKDLNLLKQSLNDLGMRFEENSKNVRFWGREPQDLDVYVSSQKMGFVKNASDGSYDLVGDSDYRKSFNKVRQKYSENVARNIVRQRGFKVADVKQQADGKLTLVVKRRAYA